MAKYLVLIYGDEREWAAESAQQRQQKTEAHMAFAVQAGEALIDGNELEPSVTATSLRMGSPGRPTVTDGPFLETKEALGGYCLLEAADLDQAISLARRLPEVALPHSGVEIRPVREFD
jgi:hypothetical protein